MPDAVTEAPNVYKVLEENAKVRILVFSQTSVVRCYTG